MTLTLYHSAYSTCSQKVRLTLAEKNLNYASIELCFRKEEHLTPEYLAINPFGVVPTLVHNKHVVADSSVIVEYLEEVFPDPPLAPSNPIGRARMRAWLRFMEEMPTKAIRVPSFEKVFLPSLRLISSKTEFRAKARRRPLRKSFYERMNQGKGFDEQEISESNNQLQMTIDRMESALADSDWLLGDELTLVDLTLAPLIDRMLDLGMIDFFHAKGRTLAWLERLQDRSSYDVAFYKGSRISERTEFQYARLRNWLYSKLEAPRVSQQGNHNEDS